MANTIPNPYWFGQIQIVWVPWYRRVWKWVTKQPDPWIRVVWVEVEET